MGGNPHTSKAKRGGVIRKSAEREFRMDLGLVSAIVMEISETWEFGSFLR
jgi:hypothetical protein